MRGQDTAGILRKAPPPAQLGEQQMSMAVPLASPDTLGIAPFARTQCRHVDMSHLAWQTKLVCKRLHEPLIAVSLLPPDAVVHMEHAHLVDAEWLRKLHHQTGKRHGIAPTRNHEHDRDMGGNEPTTPHRFEHLIEQQAGISSLVIRDGIGGSGWDGEPTGPEPGAGRPRFRPITQGGAPKHPSHNLPVRDRVIRTPTRRPPRHG